MTGFLPLPSSKPEEANWNAVLCGLTASFTAEALMSLYGEGIPADNTSVEVCYTYSI